MRTAHHSCKLGGGVVKGNLRVWETIAGSPSIVSELLFTMNAATPTCRASARSAGIPRGIGDWAAPCFLLSFTGNGGVPLARRALVQECLERRHRGLVGREIVRDLLVEMRRADVKLVRRRIFSHEVGDLVHFRDPAV